MCIKLYISAASHQIAEARHVADVLAVSGHKITSEWHEVGIEELNSEEVVRGRFRGIVESDAIVVLNSKNVDNGCKFFETGLAVGRDIDFYLIGETENPIMSLLFKTRSFVSVEALAKHLEKV